MVEQGWNPEPNASLLVDHAQNAPGIRIHRHHRAVVRPQGFHRRAANIQVLAIHVVAIGGIGESRLGPGAAGDNRRRPPPRRDGVRAAAGREVALATAGRTGTRPVATAGITTALAGRRPVNRGVAGLASFRDGAEGRGRPEDTERQPEAKDRETRDAG